ncbi:MAG: DNA (cytosine-5-)-methyltransferase [Clostridiales bacterium]|nr:DNA (cytosine-5-)-methyltransferase [Clostridiales bacterium]
MYTLRIKELRKLNNITQSQLAKHLNVAHQSISKWENHVTSPDIAYLPKLAAFFNVSIDVLMGLAPLESSYTNRNDITAEYWDQKYDLLIAMNHQALNDDYLRFLIRDVWKITSSVDIADFGCGYGYLGLKLLPLLPEGSTYTGYDISKKLIDHAMQLFVNHQLQGQFIECDLNDYKVATKYDLVICKSFLQHHNNPSKILRKMKCSGKSSALIVCIEENRLIRNDGLFIEDLYNPIEKAQILKENWESEYQNDGRDYYLGFRIPSEMEKLGLLDVNIRSNDCVQYMSQRNENYKHQVESLKTTMIWDQPFSNERIKNIFNYFQSRGLSKEGIKRYIEGEIKYSHHLNHHMPNIVRTLGLYITYGRKPYEQHSENKSEILE